MYIFLVRIQSKTRPIEFIEFHWHICAVSHDAQSARGFDLIWVTLNNLCWMYWVIYKWQIMTRRGKARAVEDIVGTLVLLLSYYNTYTHTHININPCSIKLRELWTFAILRIYVIHKIILHGTNLEALQIEANFHENRHKSTRLNVTISKTWSILTWLYAFD